MSNSRLDALRQSLKAEKAGLGRELEAKRKECEELQKAIAAIDHVLGVDEAPARPRQMTLGESANARTLRERKELRAALAEVLKANPDGLGTQALLEKVAPMVQLTVPLAPHRISLMLRQMREQGLGVMGDAELWIYVPGENEDAELIDTTESEESEENE